MTRDFANGIESVTSIDELDREVTDCGECPRLREWCTRVAHEKRAASRDEVYWGGPVPGFGSRQPRIWIVGLAPGAHGANRTGRMFTGDRSGDWLYASLHRTGLASQPTSTHRDDGQHLAEVRITAAVHCAPPDNKPTTAEKHTCRQWLRREAELLLPDLRAVVALGGIAWQATIDALAHAGCAISRPRPAFGHGSSFSVTDPAAIRVIGSYHPSQQNTFTGRLTEDMLDGVFIQAQRCLEEGQEPK
ncbi:MAG: uracil-DNA glycosylase [Actinomycetota bacterium]|nr:uracil-DNA glycosylase [Actinomycetota bacterium]